MPKGLDGYFMKYGITQADLKIIEDACNVNDVTPEWLEEEVLAPYQSKKIGGDNGGGKTTLFEAIYGALYGLKIHDAKDFRKFVNDGLTEKDKQEIELEIAFTGYVLSQRKQ